MVKSLEKILSCLIDIRYKKNCFDESLLDWRMSRKAANWQRRLICSFVYSISSLLIYFIDCDPLLNWYDLQVDSYYKMRSHFSYPGTRQKKTAGPISLKFCMDAFYMILSGIVEALFLFLIGNPWYGAIFEICGVPRATPYYAFQVENQESASTIPLKIT